MSKTRVRGHTRTSKNGKQHHVRAHRREVTWKDILNMARGEMKAKNVGAAAIGTASIAAISYTLYGLLSLTAAVMCAIAMVSIGFLSWAVNHQRPKRRQSWVKRKFGGVLSPRRRARAWWHGKKRRAIRSVIPKFIRKYAR